MPSDKRERQRQRTELARLASERRMRRQRIIRVAVVFVMITAIGGASALAFLDTGDSTDVASTAPSTTLAPGTTAPLTPTPEAPSCPPLADVAAKAEMFTEAPPLSIDPTKKYIATITTDSGVITAELDPTQAPVTVNNFVFLARAGFYDGVRFHRVLRGFVIQGGDPTASGSGGPGYAFADELPTVPVGTNATTGSPLYYEVGSLAMANSGPDTNGSQFFIITGDNGAALPPSYSRFGKVVDGTAVVAAIESDGSDQDGIPMVLRHCMLSVTISEQ